MVFGEEQPIWLFTKAQEPIEANWDDLNVFYKPILRSVTFSEFDKHERPGYYFYEIDIPANVEARFMQFMPTNFIQSYTVNTRKGKLKYICNAFSQMKRFVTNKHLCVLF